MTRHSLGREILEYTNKNAKERECIVENVAVILMIRILQSTWHLVLNVKNAKNSSWIKGAWTFMIARYILALHVQKRFIHATI